MFTNVLDFVSLRADASAKATTQRRWSLAEFLLARFRFRPASQPRLVLIERISLAPRQLLALIEVDGHRVLVATSQDGAPAFYPLGATDRSNSRHSSSIRPSRAIAGEGKRV